MLKCKVAKNVEVGGVKYKVVDPNDACAAVNRVLAKHEGSKVITPNEYEGILEAKETGKPQTME